MQGKQLGLVIRQRNDAQLFAAGRLTLPSRAVFSPEAMIRPQQHQIEQQGFKQIFPFGVHKSKLSQPGERNFAFPLLLRDMRFERRIIKSIEVKQPPRRFCVRNTGFSFPCP